MKKSWLIALLLTTYVVLSPAARAEDRASPASRSTSPEAQGFTLSLGAFDTADDAILELGIEYRFAPFRIQGVPFIPAVGLAGTEDGNVWVYGGVRYDWEVSKHWVITPHFGVSLYEEGDGKDLGGPIEFRSGLEIAYRFERGSRLGVVFYHLSNADIYDENPGSNSLALVWNF